MSTARLLLAAACAAALAACAGQETRVIADSGDIVTDTDWYEQSSSPGQAAPAPQAVLRLSEGRFSLRGPCNSHSGAWHNEGGTWTFGGEGGAIASTRMLCPPPIMEREQAMLELLVKPLRAELAGTSLWLRADDGRSLRFDQRELTEAGRERILQVAAQRAPCTGVVETLCLQIRFQPGEPWQLLHGEIEGFAWQSGTEYVLRVREMPKRNAPADASAVRWVLEEVLDSSADAAPSRDAGR